MEICATIRAMNNAGRNQDGPASRCHGLSTLDEPINAPIVDSMSPGSGLPPCINVYIQRINCNIMLYIKYGIIRRLKERLMPFKLISSLRKMPESKKNNGT